MYEAKETINQ